jgi:predicted enzyme related to lactoylglutathione lyase
MNLKSRRPLLGAVLVGAAVVALAASLGSEAPSAAENDAGRFVWHDLMTENLTRSQEFYGLLLGWKYETIRETEPAYVAIKHGDKYIGGMVAAKREDPAVPVSQWLSYIAVDDPDASVAKAKAAGARVLQEPFDAAGIARAAVVADQQGALVGFARFNKVRPDLKPVQGEWLWMEYVATDPEAAMRFYGDVIGYQHEQIENQGDVAYHVLSLGKPRAGVFKSPFEGVRANWLPYVLVDDPAALAARAQSLGGTIVVAPRPDLRKGTLAIIADPTGAVIALQKYPIS